MYFRCHVLPVQYASGTMRFRYQLLVELECMIKVESYCCTASEAAVHISYTGKISIRLTTFVYDWTTMPRALATIMLCDTCLHRHVLHEFFRAGKKPYSRDFVVSGNGILGKLTKNGQKSAGITICWYISVILSIIPYFIFSRILLFRVWEVHRERKVTVA